jgi:hypothetical protein
MLCTSLAASTLAQHLHCNRSSSKSRSISYQPDQSQLTTNKMSGKASTEFPTQYVCVSCSRLALSHCMMFMLTLMHHVSDLISSCWRAQRPWLLHKPSSRMDAQPYTARWEPAMLFCTSPRSGTMHRLAHCKQYATCCSHLALCSCRTCVCDGCWVDVVGCPSEGVCCVHWLRL